MITKREEASPYIVKAFLSVLIDCNPLVICASFPRKPSFKFVLLCFTSFTRGHYSYMFIFIAAGDKKITA